MSSRCRNRLVIEYLSEYPSLTAASASVAKHLGVGSESVRRWVVQAQVDSGGREGMTTEEREQVKTLKAKVARLQDSAILKAGAVFFVRELDPRNR